MKIVSFCGANCSKRVVNSSAYKDFGLDEGISAVSNYVDETYGKGYKFVYDKINTSARESVFATLQKGTKISDGTFDLLIRTKDTKSPIKVLENGQLSENYKKAIDFAFANLKARLKRR